MKTKTIAGTGVFLALTIAFTLISNYIQIGTVSINLALIPIALAGIVFGPVAGFLVGFIGGAFLLFAPSTATFMAVNAFGTVIICLFKGGLAGLISAILYKLIAKKNELVGAIVSSLTVPILNTSLFILGSLVFYQGSFQQLVTLFVTINFAIEFGSTVLLTPVIKRILMSVKYHKNEQKES
ncbi:MAG: ECF transporter S component [Bacilli bacterium]|nr:ECF transporter S component [Bacilli bacterium]